MPSLALDYLALGEVVLPFKSRIVAQSVTGTWMMPSLALGYLLLQLYRPQGGPNAVGELQDQSDDWDLLQQAAHHPKCTAQPAEEPQLSATARV